MKPPARSCPHRLWVPLWSWILAAPLLALSVSGWAATGEGLAARLDEAIQQVERARAAGNPLPDRDSLFPETEEIAWRNGAIRVDHASLRAEWGAVPIEGEERRKALDRLEHRLAAVRAELGPPGGSGVSSRFLSQGGAPAARPEAQEKGRGAPSGIPPPPGWRETLSEILSRPEFKKQPAGEPLLARILRWVWDKLGSLFPSGAGREAGRVAGWIVYGLAAAALLLALGVLLRTAIPLFRRERGAAPGGAPAAAGSAETPDALLTRAEACARGGDFRGAVQATFRWMLVRLHRAGRLRYDPALTNREHLDRLTADAATATAFAEVCRQFERVWYGLEPVGPEEYAAFRGECGEMGGGRA